MVNLILNKQYIETMNDSNDYQWNIGLQSATSKKGKDFNIINVATSLLTAENKAKNDNIKNFLINDLNLTVNEDGTFNSNQLANYAIEMTTRKL